MNYYPIIRGHGGKVMNIGTRVYAECDTCGWGCSGRLLTVEDKADEHEEIHYGHTVIIKEFGE